MNGASFEALYSAFTRMHVQKTWKSIMNAPMTLDDILLGEWMWATIKGAMAGFAMLLVLTALGAVPLLSFPIVLMVLVVTALAFAGIGLAVNAVSPGYDFFSYYFTLFITPMMMLSGAFFPLSVLPEALQIFSNILPLTAAVKLVRAALNNSFDIWLLLSLMLLFVYAFVGIYIAALLTRKRLLQ